jgi:hypothetical protein
MRIMVNVLHVPVLCISVWMSEPRSSSLWHCRWAQDLAGLDALPALDAAGMVAAGSTAEAAALAERLPDLRRKANASTVLEKLRMLRAAK